MESVNKLFIYLIDGFLAVAQHELVNQITDIQSREDFDSYMRSLEHKYYQKANVPEPPYQQMPDFPPKPFQTRKSKES